MYIKMHMRDWYMLASLYLYQVGYERMDYMGMC
jgi:hypothetical protein